MSGPFAAASAADKQAIEKLTLDLQSYDDRWDELAAFAKSDVNEVVADLAARANEALKMKPQDARDRFQGLVQAHADAIHKLIDLQALGKLAADFMDDFMAIKASTSQLQTIKDTNKVKAQRILDLFGMRFSYSSSDLLQDVKVPYLTDVLNKAKLAHDECRRQLALAEDALAQPPAPLVAPPQQNDGDAADQPPSDGDENMLPEQQEEEVNEDGGEDDEPGAEGSKRPSMLERIKSTRARFVKQIRDLDKKIGVAEKRKEQVQYVRVKDVYLATNFRILVDEALFAPNNDEDKLIVMKCDQSPDFFAGVVEDWTKRHAAWVDAATNHMIDVVGVTEYVQKHGGKIDVRAIDSFERVYYMQGEPNNVWEWEKISNILKPSPSIYFAGELMTEKAVFGVVEKAVEFRKVIDEEMTIALRSGDVGMWQ